MSWPSDAEFQALVLAVPCFRCGGAAGAPCLTDPGQEKKRDLYTGKKRP